MLRAAGAAAEPDLEETDRRPHFTTLAPPARRTREAPVEILMVLVPPPPVPAESMMPWPVMGKGREALRKALAAPARSAKVSPRVRMVANRAAMWISS